MNIRRRIRVVCLLGICGAATASRGLAQPPNNTCAAAQQISVSGLNIGLTVNGSSINATSDIAQTCSLGDSLDVWYTFTAPATGIWYFDTINSIMFDTTLAAYATCGGTQVACNDDIDTENTVFWSGLTRSMTAGQTIKLRVAGANFDADLFQVNVVGTATSASDSCATPLTILANQPMSGNTMTAGTDFVLSPATCGTNLGSGGGRDVFFAFTPTATAPYKISLCGSAFDTVLAVLRDCTGTAGSVVTCNDDSPLCANSLNSQIESVGLTAGVRYLIRVAGYDFSPPDLGMFTLLITTNQFGICCRGATCSFLIPSQCTPPGGRAGLALGMGQACNAAGVRTTPCCYADYNKSGSINIQDVFDYLSDWFLNSPFADVGGIGNTPPTVQDIFDFLSAWFAGGC